MKKIISILLIITLIVTAFVPVVSADAANENDRNVEYLEDGSYFVIEISDSQNENETDSLSVIVKFINLIKRIIDMLSGTKHISKTKFVNYYDSNNVLLWTFYLNADFSYNGKSSSCTRASVSYDIKDNDWRVSSCNCYKESNYSIGTISIQQYKLGITLKKINKQLTISCSADGIIE